MNSLKEALVLWDDEIKGLGIDPRLLVTQTSSGWTPHQMKRWRRVDSVRQFVESSER